MCLWNVKQIMYMIQNNVQKFISVKCTYIFIKEGGVLSWLKYNLHTIKFTHLKYTIQWFYIFRIVQPSPLSNYKTFLSLQKEIPYPLAATPFPTPSPSLWPPPVCFLTMDLSILDFPYMWNYEVYVLFISVQFSRSVVSDSLRPYGLQHWPLQNPGWWELVSSLFLTRTSCGKCFLSSAAW